MAYRNGIYVAFDGLGTTSPILGDIKYFNLLKGWHANDSDEFIFSDSHQKTHQVRDGTTKEHLKSVLRKRLSHSKSMILILTDNTRPNRELLNYEIKKAIEFGLPIIICYGSVKTPIDKPSLLAYYWPLELKLAIKNGTAKCIHIPFRKQPICAAVAKFSIHHKNTLGPLSIYSMDTYTKWGI